MQVYQRRNPDVKQPQIVSKIVSEINNLPGKKMFEITKRFISIKFPLGTKVNYLKIRSKSLSSIKCNRVTKRQSFLCSIKIVKKQSPLTSPSTLTRP